MTPKNYSFPYSTHGPNKDKPYASQKSESYFKNLFYKISDVAQELDVEIKIPRKCGLQVYRENYSATDPEILYRQSIYIPALDNVIQDLEARFSIQTLELYHFSVLFPKQLGADSFDNENVKILVKKYQDFLSDPPEMVIKELEVELERWNMKFLTKEMTFYGVIDFLKHCDPTIYPNMNFFLRIAATLPVSNASTERVLLHH